MPTQKIKPVTAAMKTVKPKQKVEVSLPTEFSEIKNEISDFTFFIYGHQKIGKTSFSTQFPEPFHIMMEPGAKRYKVKAVYPETWEEFIAYVKLLSTTENEFKTVVIDTVDILWEKCCDWVCREAGVELLKDIGFGDGYTRAGKAMRNALISIAKNYGLICFSHAKDKKLEKVSANQFNSVDYTHPSCGNKCAEVLGKWCDLTGYYYIGEDGKRYLRILPSGDIEAGNRIDNCFQYDDGKRIQDVPMGNSPQEAYQSFISSFKNELKKPKLKTLKFKSKGE